MEEKGGRTLVTYAVGETPCGYDIPRYFVVEQVDIVEAGGYIAARVGPLRVLQSA